MLATTESTLHRAVISCGSTQITGLENIRAPIMAHCAQYDFRTTGIAIPTQKQTAEFGEKFTYYVYPGLGNGFFDDTGPRYDAAAANLAWNRTLEFLKSSG